VSNVNIAARKCHIKKIRKEHKMNNKRKWILGVTRAIILFLLPSLVLILFLPDGGYRMSLGALFLMGLIMIAWLGFVVFGISEEG
jgi:hypothetical protein